MEASYKIVSAGCQEGADPRQVAQRVAALFRCQPGDVEALLRPKRRTVKRKLDLQRADRYRRALQECGLLVEIVEEAPLGAVTPSLRGRLLPRLRNAAHPGGGKTIPLAGDLALSYYYRYFNNEDDLTAEELAAFGLGADELHALAIDNLHRIVEPGLTAKQIKMVPPTSPDGQMAAYFHYIETGNALEAAYLLLGASRHRLQDTVEGGLRIVVPTAGECFFCGADDVLTLVMMYEIGGEKCREAGDQGLSARLYTVDAAGRPVALPEPVEEQAQVQILVQQMWRDAHAARALDTGAAPAPLANPAENASVEALLEQMRYAAEEERARRRDVHRRVLASISIFCVLMLLWAVW